MLAWGYDGFAHAGVAELACVGVADPLLARGCGAVLHGAGEAWTGLGAQRGEIPAASAGMTG